jgi:anti-sigma regulatory factor (Ser/Thr protein kinase)
MGAVTGHVSMAENLGWFSVDGVGDVGAARRAAAVAGTRLGLGSGRTGELEIVVAELAGNLYKHAGGGSLVLRTARAGEQAGVQVISVDAGPGIADLREAARDGHSTAGTLGIGLGAVGRLASSWDGYSQPGRGTVIAAEIWPDGGARQPCWVDGLTRPMAGESISGDAFAVRQAGNAIQLMLCDGLGHGPLAHLASQAGVEAFMAAPPVGPAAVVERMHQGMRHTRGGAVGVAQVDAASAVVTFAGVGNVAGTLVGAEQRSMISLPGIAGHQRRTVREYAYPLPAGDLVVLHSDGVSHRWRLCDYPGLIRCGPLVVATTVLRDVGVHRDDATVLVARVPR